MRPSIGLTVGGGGGNTRTWASALPFCVAIAARPTAPAAAVLKNSRRLGPSASGAPTRCGLRDQEWPPQFVKLQRGILNGFMVASFGLDGARRRDRSRSTASVARRLVGSQRTERLGAGAITWTWP